MLKQKSIWPFKFFGNKSLLSVYLFYKITYSSKMFQDTDCNFTLWLLLIAIHSHARLNSHYEAWSYKKKRSTKSFLSKNKYGIVSLQINILLFLEHKILSLTISCSYSCIYRLSPGKKESEMSLTELKGNSLVKNFILSKLTMRWSVCWDVSFMTRAFCKNR